MGDIGTARLDKDRMSTWTLGAVGVAGAALNIPIVYGMALAAGYPTAVASLYWVILDFFELSSMRVYLRARSVKIRRWAGASAVFGLLISASAAGMHVFVEHGQLPKWVAFGVLTLPAVMIGLALHQVMMLRIERAGEAAQAADETSGSKRAVAPKIGAQERSEGLQKPAGVTEGRSGHGTTKRARFEAALVEVTPEDERSTNDLVAELNKGIDLHPGTARRLVGAWRQRRATGGAAALQSVVAS